MQFEIEYLDLCVNFIRLKYLCNSFAFLFRFYRLLLLLTRGGTRLGSDLIDSFGTGGHNFSFRIQVILCRVLIVIFHTPID